MTEIRLLRATYRSLPVDFSESALSSEARLELLATHISDHVEACLGDLGPSEVGTHFISSTIIDIALASRAGAADALLQAISGRCKHPPAMMMNAYECAGWGFIQRHVLQTGAAPCRIACTIVDLNVYDFAFWRESPHWGKSGFGIAVLLLELGESAAVDLAIGCAKTANMLAEFAMAVRTFTNGREGAATPLVALPFFPSQVSEMFDRIIPNIRRLPDQHAALGHCFGSDPWILAIQHVLRHGIPIEDVLCCSVALNGYWAIARVEIAADARIALDLAK